MKKLALAGAIALGLGVAGCGDDTKNKDSNQQNNTPQCYSGAPTTNDQIITACTAASVITIDLSPVVKHLKPDGTLPTPPDPLPS